MEPTAEEVQDVLKRLAGGKIFSVVFIKRTDGEEREMRCRLGVTQTRGIGERYDALENALIRVYDMDKGAWRSIPVEGIRQITIGGVTYDFGEE